MSEHVLDPPDDLPLVASAVLRTGFHVSPAASEGTDGAVLLRLSGELDMASAPGLGRALDAALDGRPSAVALDLTELGFVDSTGLRLLIGACRRAGGQGCSFVLRSPGRSVRKALVLTGLDRLMVIEPDTPLV